MKIGILTFHFATNYGAVLQSFALQEYLSRMGHGVEIIDYTPSGCHKGWLQCFNPRQLKNLVANIQELKKEIKFRRFRTKHLVLSARKYNSILELSSYPPASDAYICGSDQIWNKGLSSRILSDVGSSMPYFLDFGVDGVKRIAYAASFGDAMQPSEYPSNLWPHVVRCLSRFSAISVREQSGITILNSLGMQNACVMPDPTLLLDVGDYDKLACRKAESEFFFYSLHREQLEMGKALKLLKEKSKSVTCVTMHTPMGIEDWLGHIRAARNVVTNSFHGVVLAILFRRPFIAIPVTGPLAKMNDRLFTLLGRLNLTDRILITCEESQVTSLLARSIDWPGVRAKIADLRHDARIFFDKNIDSTS